MSFYSDAPFRGNRPLSLILFEGGLVYGFYQSDYSAAVFPQFAYAGFFVGTADAPGDAAATYRITDFDFDAKSANAGTLTLTGGGSTTVSGQLSVSSGATDSIGGAYASVSTAPTDTATLARAYGGYIRSVAGGAALAATLTAAGQLSASTSTGCSVSATLKPRPLGNLYDVKANLGTSCPAPVGPYRGHAFQSLLSRNVYLMLTSDGYKDGVLVHLFDPPS